MTDEERLSAINETINKLRDKKTGLSSLKNLITDALKTEPTLIAAANQHILNKTGKTEHEPLEHLDVFIWCVLFKKIQRNEKSHAKTPSEFKKTIGDEIKEIVKVIPKLSKKELKKNLKNYDDKRNKLNATPGIFMKYGFTTSCSNGAVAFIDEFTKEHSERKQYVKFMFTTVWDHLLNGRSGHTVPCVKLNNGDWIIIEPRNPTFPKGEFTKRISKDDFQVGKSFKHLMTFRNGEPYMIRAKLDKPFTDHEVFLEKASRVSLEDAKKFLAQVANEKYWSPGVHKQIERELKILSDLTPEEQELPPEELQEIIEEKRGIERERRTESLRSATEELGKQVQQRPFSMDELKRAQAQQAFDY
ncbi:MAG: hypothetical protein ACLRFF_01365 [Alphaproteobacteria bacterium]